MLGVHCGPGTVGVVVSPRSEVVHSSRQAERRPQAAGRAVRRRAGVLRFSACPVEIGSTRRPRAWWRSGCSGCCTSTGRARAPRNPAAPPSRPGRRPGAPIGRGPPSDQARRSGAAARVWMPDRVGSEKLEVPERTRDQLRRATADDRDGVPATTPDRGGRGLAVGVLVAGGRSCGPALAVAVTPPVASTAPAGRRRGSASPGRAPGRVRGPGVVVHVLGAVREPGLVTLAAGSRVQDAIETAGGLTVKADPGESTWPGGDGR